MTTPLPSAARPTLAPERPAALEAVDLSKHYGTGDGRFDALRGVSLRIDAGESVAIVGKSGSGKSTLMHLLAALDTASSGSVLIHGQDARTLSPRALDRLRNREFGFVFQQFFLNAQQSVLENVTLPLAIGGIRRTARRARGLEVLGQLGLADKADARAVTLSGGQKQRAVIARALSGSPSIIFADEPTGNLDSATGETVEEMLFSLHREQGITLVIVTHDDELAARCARQVVLRDGAIVSDSARPALEGVAR
jgi:putative ABC transport system ATP-binding protein